MTRVTHAAVDWDGYSPSDLASLTGVPRVELLAHTTSTLDVAHALAAQEAPAGTVVLADSQQAGRGRLGRAWTSPPGRGVWLSIVERPRDASALDVLSLRVGLRVAAAMDTLAGEQVGLKWPNDLMLAAGKVGGILIETRFSGDSPAWVAIGIGVNVRPPEISGAAGLPAHVRRADVFAAIVPAARAAAASAGSLRRSELEAWRARDVLAGRRVTSPAEGVVRGIDASGALIVEAAGGAEAHRAGTIRLAEAS